MSQKIFDDDLAPIHKSEVTLTLIKTAYVGMDIIDLSNVLMLQFHYDYIKDIYANSSRLLLTGTGCLIQNMYMKILVRMKKCFLAIILLSQNIMMIQRNGAYKDVLLNNKYQKHSMDRIQSKDYRIGTYKLNNLFLI